MSNLQLFQQVDKALHNIFDTLGAIQARNIQSGTETVSLVEAEALRVAFQSGYSASQQLTERAKGVTPPKSGD